MIRKTPAQKKAYDAYSIALLQEERYSGSVFANAAGQRIFTEKIQAAYRECRRLGLGPEHGLFVPKDEIERERQRTGM